MTFFEKIYFLFKAIVKVELSNIFTINMFATAENCMKSELSYKIALVGNYLRPSNNYRQLIFNINAVVSILIIC